MGDRSRERSKFNDPETDTAGVTETRMLKSILCLLNLLIPSGGGVGGNKIKTKPKNHTQNQPTKTQQPKKPASDYCVQ